MQKTMVLCKKTMVLYRKLLNFDLRTKKTWQITKTKETLIYYGEKNSNFPKIFKILNKFIALELTMDKLWYYGDIMVLWKNYVLS